ncbi:SLC13 family permease [Luteimonas sp. e5]
MSFDLLVTLLVLAAAAVLFVTEKLPVDVVALGVLCALLATGVVTPGEALSGFASQATITVAAMFVLSAALQKSGVVDAFGRLIGGIRWPWLLMLATMLVSAGLSAFVNNTAIVAILLPVIAAAAVRNKQRPSKYLIPLSFAAQMGGVCTLIGTSTNLLVDSLARDAGHAGFSIFEFAPLGIWFVVAGVIYMMLVGRFLLPNRTHAAEDEAGPRGRYGAELQVNAHSKGIGEPGAQFIAPDYGDVVLREIRREGRLLPNPRQSEVKVGDRVLVYGDWSEISKLVEEYQLGFDDVAPDLAGDATAKRELAEVMISPRSSLIGKTLKQTRFGHAFRVRVLGLHKADGYLRQPPQHAVLGVGDILMVDGSQSAISLLDSDPGMVVLSRRERPRLDLQRTAIAVAVMIAVIGVAALGWLPIVATALIGCGALVILGCLSPEEAYAAVDWRVVVLLAGVLPLGIALQKTGSADWLTQNTLGRMGDFGPLVILTLVYLITGVLTELMSNNAAAVLVVPIALATAESMGINAKPLLVAVAFAASTAFITPVGYQTNTMAYTAGGYRFSDFPKVGLPLNVVFAVMAIWLIPRYFPF